MLQKFSNSFNLLIDKLSGWLDLIVTSLPNLILAIIVMALSIWFSGLVKDNIKKLMSRFSDDKSINNLIGSTGSILIVLLALFVSLGILNLDQALTSLLATAGIAGLAVGMALQEPIMNTFSGIMMSLRKFYNIGDWIETNGYEGQIQQINLRWSVLQKPSGEKIMLPNKMIINNPVENYSIAGRRRVEVECGVAYESDLKKVKAIATEAVAEHFDYIDSATEVEFFFTSFAGSSIDFVIRFWMETTSLIEYKTAKSEAIMAIKAAFDKHEISIPFPIRTLDFSMAEGFPQSLSPNSDENQSSQMTIKQKEERQKRSQPVNGKKPELNN